MISEKKINYYLHFAKNSYNEECHKIITQLVDEVRKLLKDLDGLAHDHTALELTNARLEKEANWVANKASINCPSTELEEKCTHKPLGKNKCVECWREEARKAVKKNDS